jgi:hypothetical protein
MELVIILLIIAVPLPTLTFSGLVLIVTGTRAPSDTELVLHITRRDKHIQ